MNSLFRTEPVTRTGTTFKYVRLNILCTLVSQVVRDFLKAPLFYLGRFISCFVLAFKLRRSRFVIPFCDSG